MAVRSLGTRSILDLAICVGISIIAGCSQRSIPPVADGTYYGYDELPNLSPEDPSAYWYHENTLVVHRHAIRLTQKPFTLINGKAIPQPADGGFYTFEGTQTVEGDRVIVELRLVSCDYCAVPEYDSIPSRIVRAYVIQKVPKAAFELDRVRYQTTRDSRLHPPPSSDVH